MFGGFDRLLAGFGGDAADASTAAAVRVAAAAGMPAGATAGATAGGATAAGEGNFWMRARIVSW